MGKSQIQNTQPQVVLQSQKQEKEVVEAPVVTAETTQKQKQIKTVEKATPQVKEKVPILKKTKQIKKEDKVEKKPNIKGQQIQKKSQKHRLFSKIQNFTQIMQEKTQKYQKVQEKLTQKLIIDKEQVSKAVQALLAFHDKNKVKNNLLDKNDDFIYVEFNLSAVPVDYSIRPIQVPISTPIYSERYNSRFCVFVSDPQRTYKDLIQDLNIPMVERAIGYSKIEQKFPTFKEKHKLFYSYDFFFCDYKIYDLLRKPLGKIFYQRKKYPFPIDCQQVPEYLNSKLGTDYEKYLNDLSKHTYLIMGNGPVYTLKIARVDMNQQAITQNILEGIFNGLPHIITDQVKVANVQSISIKTFNSTSLPIYTALSQEAVEAFLQPEQE